MIQREYKMNARTRKVTMAAILIIMGIYAKVFDPLVWATFKTPGVEFVTAVVGNGVGWQLGKFDVEI